MGLYNVLFGQNPLAPVLKSILQLDEEGGWDTGRFRDIYLNKDATRIILYTRNGGGNREDYADVIANLHNHPNFLSDYDDDFDCTYAYFEFSVPEEIAGVVALFAPDQDPKTVHERFSEEIEGWQTRSREEMMGDARLQPLFEILKRLSSSTGDPT